MRLIAVLVVVAGVGLVGCAGGGMWPQASGDGGGPKPLADCDGHGVCKVTISVTKCVATAVPDTLYVKEKNVNIQWELDLLSWFGGNTFDDNDGIVVKDPKNQFDQPTPSGFGKKYALRDKNDSYGTFTYRIHVKSILYGDCPHPDPTIVNQG